MGKALNQGAFKWTAEQTAQILNNKALTICFWVYVDLDTGSTSNRAMFFGNDPMSSAGGRQFSLFNYSTSNDLHWSWQNYINGTYSMVTSGIVKDVIPSRTWTHIAVTYENPNGTIYINGVQQQTFSGAYNADSFAFETQVIHDSQYHRFNDYRIYDECLSSKQIKEIAKGLCAHYKLEGVGANANLLTNSQNTIKPDNADSITWCNNVTSYSKDTQEDCAHLVVPTTGNPNNGIGYVFNTADTTLGLSHNQTITFSCDIKGIVGTDLPYLAIRMNFGSEGTWYSNGKGYVFSKTSTMEGVTENTFKRYSVTYTIPADNSNYDAFKLFLCIHANYGGNFYIKNVKLELGEATPWIPNEADSLYTELGYNKALTTDVSGFGYNGTITGELTFDSDSPRYAGSTKFSGPGYIHYLSSPLNSSTDAFTFTCWFNPTQASNMALYNDRTVVGSGFSVFYLGGALRFDTGSNSEFQFSNDTSILNKWSFIACTYDKNNGIKKAYINGIQVGSTSSIGDLTQIGTNASIGNSSTNAAAGAGNQIYGSLSDVRIYCTALSAEDILKLYEISGIIDNKGNTYSYEFIEED